MTSDAPLSLQNATYFFVNAFVDELARSGVQNVVICPGSRSTPLAMTFASQTIIKVWMHLDERSAAFFALGMAKASRKPVAVVCTSGTAAANFMPAVVEAHYSRVPLIILTADRPPELRDIGAPQTIDQLRLYGTYAKWFIETTLPEATPAALRYIRTVACRAVAESLSPAAGPVHVNFPFREPLVPIPPESPVDLQDRQNSRPYAETTQGLRRVDPLALQIAASKLTTSRGLIISGPQDDPEFPAAVARLASALNYPILADPLSGVRCGPHNRANVIDAYDAFLRDPVFVARVAPKVVLQFGATPTSKPLLQYTQNQPGRRHLLIDGGNGWNDPALLASDVFHVDARWFCDSLLDIINKLPQKRRDKPRWQQTWLETNRRAREAIAAQMETFEETFEGRIFSELSEMLPETAMIFTSSSMPVRDLDTFFPSSGHKFRFLSNRGANGIDGVVSSALGASAVSDGPTVLVIGDIAFYHDMNGLLAAKLHDLNLIVVVVNNDGGGIFSFLPQADYPEHFEQLFGTPHGLDFRPVAELYRAGFSRPHDWGAFRAAVLEGIAFKGLNIIEVRTDRKRNVALHRAIWPAVAAAIHDPIETWDKSQAGQVTLS